MDHIPLIGVEGLELADGHAVLAGDPVVGIARLRRISLFHDRLRGQMGPHRIRADSGSERIQPVHYLDILQKLRLIGSRTVPVTV